jgi:4-carboxymuconolactone decarboxylase
MVIANHERKGTPEMSDDSAETPVLDLIATMTAASMDASKLDPQTLMLVRIAALVAVNAPPSSYLLNLGAAGDVGVDGDQVRDVLAAVAPIVGTARVASAVGNVVRALGFAELVAEQQLAEGA